MPIMHSVMGDIKQVIAVRTDLGMGKGKIAAQVGHACVLGAEHVRKSHPEWWSEWWGGQEKVVVKVSGLKELQEIKKSLGPITDNTTKRLIENKIEQYEKIVDEHTQQENA